MRTDLAARAAALSEARVPYVQATVVRAARPASVQVGATALVLGDGTIEGFVGGHCAEPSVRLHALRVLETGEPLGDHAVASLISRRSSCNPAFLPSVWDPTGDNPLPPGLTLPDATVCVKTTIGQFRCTRAPGPRFSGRRQGLAATSENSTGSASPPARSR